MLSEKYLIGAAVGVGLFFLATRAGKNAGSTVGAKIIEYGDLLNDAVVPDFLTYEGATIGTVAADVREGGTTFFNTSANFGAAGINAITPDFISLRDGASFEPGSENFVDASNPVSRAVDSIFAGGSFGGWLHETFGNEYDPNSA